MNYVIYMQQGLSFANHFSNFFFSDSPHCSKEIVEREGGREGKRGEDKGREGERV